MKYLLLAMCLNCGLYNACASGAKEAPPPAVAAKAETAADDCRRMTVALEESVRETDAVMKAQFGKLGGAQVTRVQCEGRKLVAQILMSAMEDDEYAEVIVVVGLSVNEKNKIEAQVLGAQKVDKE